MNLDMLTVWARQSCTDFGYVPLVLVLLFLGSRRSRMAVGSGRLGSVKPGPPLSRTAGWWLAVGPVAFWLLSLACARFRPALYLHAMAEDGWLENGQMLLLLLAALVSGRISHRCLRASCRVWSAGYLLLALVLCWAAGEEISWGQRLFNLPTPEWFATHNVQQEVNLHNLFDVDDRLSEWTDNALVGAILCSAGFSMGKLRTVRRLHAPLWVPSPVLIPALVCIVSYGQVLAFYAVAGGSPDAIPEAIAQLQESRELILYGAVCAFLWSALGYAGDLRSVAERDRRSGS